MNKIRVLLISFMALLAVSTIAKAEKKDDNTNPLGCRDVGYEFDMRLLHLKPGAVGERNSMYFIHNKLGQKLTLYQLRKDESARSMFLNHLIYPNQWAVLSINEVSMKFACSVKNAGKKYGELVDCADAITVCEFNNVKFGLNNRGNYWIVGSSSRNGALRSVVYYGIIPAQ
ncbi:endopeptidase IV [Legionella sp. W05-934-2]|jgi:hypothetical protein|uniref:endopeptidase IV n=1 Tax=Legionella sp. W05-934-2 TaxID=1198649 RepID=UPI003461FC6F